MKTIFEYPKFFSGLSIGNIPAMNDSGLLISPKIKIENHSAAAPVYVRSGEVEIAPTNKPHTTYKTTKKRHSGIVVRNGVMV